MSGGRGPSGGLGSSPPRRDEVLQEPRAALWAEEAVNTGGTAQERGRPWPSGERTSHFEGEGKTPWVTSGHEAT